MDITGIIIGLVFSILAGIPLGVQCAILFDEEQHLKFVIKAVKLFFSTTSQMQKSFVL